MFEKMFTTKMSMDKEKLQNRFSKIRSKNGKTSKFIAMAVFAIIIVSIICVSIWVAVNRQDDTTVNSDIKLTFNGEIISFQNDPYIFSETLSTGLKTQTMAYFPLEELCQKLGAECEVNGNKAIIKVSNVDYQIEVGKNQIFYDTNGKGFQPINFTPEIKNYTIYIPYEFVKYIWVYANEYDISGSILYKNEKMNMQFEIPMHWLGEYIADETTVNDNYIAFKHKRIAEKHDGMGTLFSVVKLPDSEIDEYVNMVGNMTVVWRNQDYGHLIARPTDVQVPIFAGNDEEDIKLAEEYQKMYKDVSYIESTFSLINDVGTPNIVNAENLSYAQIKDLQRQVDNGHFPWRLNYEQVVQSFLSGKEIDVEGGEIIAFAGDGEKCSATYLVDGNAYIVDLFKPIEKSEHGIWVVKTVQKKDNATIQEVHFYERTPAQAWISKQEDGWYKVPKHISAVLQYEGYKPYSISAYFTPTGTNMESEKKLVAQEVLGRTDTNISQTPARFPLLDIDFYEEYTLGHLWFVFTFEDGSSVVSEIYNMYVE